MVDVFRGENEVIYGSGVYRLESEVLLMYSDNEIQKLRYKWHIYRLASNKQGTA